MTGPKNVAQAAVGLMHCQEDTIPDQWIRKNLFAAGPGFNINDDAFESEQVMLIGSMLIMFEVVAKKKSNVDFVQHGKQVIAELQAQLGA